MSLRNRRLSIWGSLPPYLGGKRRLCPTIFREVDRILPRRLWPGLTFLDGFLGGGSVSLYAKAQGFRVVATDIAERAITVGEALIANSAVRLTREDVLRLCAPQGASERVSGRIETQYSPSVFTPAQARILDRALAAAAQTQDRGKAALYRLLALRVALLAHPMSQVRSGTIYRLGTGEYESITESCLGQYMDGLRLTRFDRLWALAQQINSGVFQGTAQVIKASVLDVLPTIEADVAYFDPPYPGTASYEKEYRVIDEILDGGAYPSSPFSARDGVLLLDELFARAQHIPVWVLSLGNEVVGIGELEAKMARLGRTTRATEIRYQHKASVASEEKNANNREFVIVGWDEAAVERLLSGEATEHATDVQLDDLSPAFVHEDASHPGSVAAPLLRSASDGSSASRPSPKRSVPSPGKPSRKLSVAWITHTPSSRSPAVHSTVNGESESAMANRSLASANGSRRNNRE